MKNILLVTVKRSIVRVYMRELAGAMIQVGTHEFVKEKND